MAVGSHDSIIYLYNIEDNYSLKICKAHSSYITHIDFGLSPTVTDFNMNYFNTWTSEKKKKLLPHQIIMQSTCGAYELLFWLGDGKRVLSATSVRDVEWATFTCTLGWPVQGIWPPASDGTDVNSVCRSHTWKEVPVLATADDFGRVRLFNYPCTYTGLLMCILLLCMCYAWKWFLNYIFSSFSQV